MDLSQRVQTPAVPQQYPKQSYPDHLQGRLVLDYNPTEKPSDMFCNLRSFPPEAGLSNLQMSSVQDGRMHHIPHRYHALCANVSHTNCTEGNAGLHGLPPITRLATGWAPQHGHNLASPAGCAC